MFDTIHDGDLFFQDSQTVVVYSKYLKLFDVKKSDFSKECEGRIGEYK